MVEQRRPVRPEVDESVTTAGDRPSEFGRDDVLAIARRVKDRVRDDQVVVLGAGVAFFGLLALVPGMIAAVSIYGLLSDPADVQRQVEAMSEALPEAARDIIEEQLDSIVAAGATSLSFGALIGVIAALWSASSGVNHLVGALNVAYRETDDRTFVKKRGLALALTLGGVVFVVAAVGLIAVIPVVTRGAALDGAVSGLLNWLRWPLLLLAFMVALAVLYKVGPDRSSPKLRWVSWGAGIATVVWVLGSVGFSIYVSQFGNFNQTYGSLAGVIVLMLWLVLTSTIVIVGAVIDAEMEHHTAADTTAGSPRPIGERGADVADRVPDVDSVDTTQADVVRSDR